MQNTADFLLNKLKDFLLCCQAKFQYIIQAMSTGNTKTALNNRKTLTAVGETVILFGR